MVEVNSLADFFVDCLVEDFGKQGAEVVLDKLIRMRGLQPSITQAVLSKISSQNLESTVISNPILPVDINKFKRREEKKGLLRFGKK